ncbi:META domain-containing protein [Psychrobacter phenylpyruvicus]|uniref:META domain n=1 Tax=Psychrobacter phenylpyruvicus TaxID=29432 RepID=A0A379LM70_9GAMM|nr:META domain-containing protein [Psychrobacter phenylpyruvicus]SUD90977.1 META domain [Psychrobacter phenylpyruvicus]
MLSAKSLIIAMVTGSLLLVGCQNTAPATSQSSVAQSNTMTNAENELTLNAASLANYHWRLLAAKDKQGQPLSILETIKDQVHLNFFVEQSTYVDQITQHASFTVGCNSMSSKFTVSSQTLKMGDIISTEMYCQDLDQAERLMAQLMRGNSKLSIRSSKQAAISVATYPVLTQHMATGEVLVWEGTATPEAKYQQQGDIVFWEVNHQLQDCPNPDQKACLKVRPVYYDEQGIKQGVGDWDIFVEKIEGYNHDSEVDTVLRLKRFTIDPIDVKGKQFVYVLDRIVESSVVN